jgi:hypothetical protein
MAREPQPMLESIQKLAPWVSGLPTVPKLAVTAIWLLLSFLFLYLVWVPTRKDVEKSAEVQQAYDRMVRVLRRITRLPNGQTLVDGRPIDAREEGYYAKYAAIADYVAQHPRDIKGTYEEVWDQGGSGRVYTDDTEAFEAVVKEFFKQYQRATEAPQSLGPSNE